MVPSRPVLKAFFYFGLIGVVLYILSVIALLPTARGMWFVLVVYSACSFAGAPLYFPTLLMSIIILSNPVLAPATHR